jgi:carbon storage regulator
MLVLRRKQAETVVVDGRIQIKVLRISRNAISLGIDAPGDVAIWRGELEQDERLASPTTAIGAVAKLPLVQSA